MRHSKKFAEDGKPKKRHRRVETGYTSKEAWALLCRIYDYTCPACGRREPDIKLTRDHIVAVAKGGSSFVENLQPLCERCNEEKGQRQIYYPPPSIQNRAIYA